MRLLFKKLNAWGLELNPGTSLWLLILIAISAGTAAFVALLCNNTLYEIAKFAIEDIGVSANFALAIFFALIFAFEISAEVSEARARNCDEPFGMLNYLWSRMLNGIFSVMPFFCFSSSLFIAVHYLYTGELSAEFLQIILSSVIAVFPLFGLSAALAIWFSNKTLLFIGLSIAYLLAFFGGEFIPLFLRALVPDMDFFQTNLSIYYGNHGSWLYIFSLFGLSFVWMLSGTSLSSTIYNFSRGFSKYPSDHRGVQILLYKMLIIFASVLFALHINVELKKIELYETEFLDENPIIPRTGFKGLAAIGRYLYIKEIISTNQYNADDIAFIRQNFVKAATAKPSSKHICKDSYMTFTSLLAQNEEEIIEKKNLCRVAMNSYLVNPYIEKSAEYELFLASDLTSPLSQDRDENLKLALNILNTAVQRKELELKDHITKKIISLNAELLQNTVWQEELAPINKDFAELLVWFREWKRAVIFKEYSAFEQIPDIEKNIFAAADKAEKNSNGNPIILSSIEKIRRNIYLAKYIKRNFNDKL